jgi:uncharacterized membrane protein
MNIATSPHESSKPGSIRWSMIISHHPPCYYDCTFRVGSLRVCTRCFGVLLGVLTVIILRVNSHILASIIPVWVSLLLPLPAVVDFTSHRLEWWQSNNTKRLVSGLLLGLAVGVALYNLINGYTFFGIVQITWLAVLELGVAIVLKHAGKLDKYIEQYEKGMRK